MSSNKWVVISGASTGIGRATALLLARSGYGVLAGVRKPADAASVAEEARVAGLTDRLRPLTLDVTKADDVAACREHVTRLIAAGDTLACVVNNAGYVAFGPVETLPIDSWRAQFETNFFGCIALTQALIPALRPSRGRVINISSVGGKVSQPLVAAYVSSKYAMEAMSDSLRMELRGEGIHVSVVQPGAIATPIWNKGLSAEEKAIGEIPAGLRLRYVPMLKALSGAAQKMSSGAIAAERVAEVILKAMRATRPRTRYVVGTDARVLMIAKRFLSDRWMDSFLMGAMKIPE